MRYTIRNLLLTIVAGAVLLSLGVMALVFNHNLEKNLLAEKDAELTRVAEILKSMVEEDYSPDATREKMDAWATAMGRLGAYRITLVGADGALLGDTLVPLEKLEEVDDHSRRPEVIEAFEKGHGRAIRYSATAGQDFLYIATLLKSEQHPPLVLRVGAPVSILRQARLESLKAFAWVAALGLAVSFLVSWLATRGIARDTRELIAAAQDMAGGDLNRRLVRQPRNELGKLGVALNGLASRLSRQFRRSEENHRHLLATLNSMDEGVMVTGADGRVTHSNPSLLAMFALKTPPEGFLPGEAVRSPELIEAFKSAQKGESPAPLLLSYGSPEKFIEARLSPIGERGSEGVVAVFHDLTSRQKLYQMRRDFVANVSHELRTPLTAIMGATETLAKNLPADQKPVLDVLERHSRRLAELSRDILELARLDALKPSALKSAPVAIAELLNSQVAAVLAERSGEAGLAARLKVSVEEGLDKVDGDFASLAGALENLIDNALRYGDPEGPVYISAARQGALLRLEVRNQGPSVPPEDRDRIFERFYRGEKSRLRHSGGAGLGLAIVKHAAQIHGGAAALTTPPEGGSIFSITIPFKHFL